MLKILVLRGGALGDFIVTLPALAALRKKWPAARIELVGNAAAAEIARARGLLDAVHSQHEARWSALFGADPLPSDLVLWLRDFDLVISYWPDPDRELAAHFPIHAEQTFLSAAAMPARAPAAAHYCEPLRRLGIDPENFSFHLDPLEAPRTSKWKPAAPAQDSDGCIAIHPGSGSKAKNWPCDRWQEIISNLPSPVLLILGEAEIESWNAYLKDVVRDRRIRLAVNLPFEELIRELSRCAGFVGHDSGISHLAAACGLPCLLLFGPTDPSMWAPPFPSVRVLRRGLDINSISVGEVWAALA
jgi:heptosyltransferase III